MIRFVLIGLLFLSHSIVSHAMQPVTVEGTTVGAAYFNSNINVISETTDIDVSERFRKAQFTVQYEIYNKQKGSQIPLLFALYDEQPVPDISKKNMALSISVDGHSHVIQNIASGETTIGFKDFFESYQTTPDDYRMHLVEGSTNGFPNYVSFIKTDLSVGYHTIVATYDAMPSYRDNNELTYEYSYSYSFEPIKLKQDFASTTVHLTFDGDIEDVSFQVVPDVKQDLTRATNIGIVFDENLPDVVIFSYQRQFSDWVKILVIGPSLGFFILFYIVFIRWHTKAVKNMSNLKPLSTLWYVLSGSMLVPLISMTCYVLYESLAYNLMGEQKIDDMRNFFGLLAYVMLFLCLAPFYSAFIYFKYYKNKTANK